MAGSRAQLKFEQLPPKVQEELRAMQKTLGPDLKLGNYRAIEGGWAASIYTLDGEEGGDYVIMDHSGSGPS